MLGKWVYLERPIGAVLSVALLCVAVSTPVRSQDHEGAAGQELTATAEDYQRFEAERLRQQQLDLEIAFRKQEKLRFETERLRQENERHKQEQLRLENERLRQEIERREQEQAQLRLENEAREQERAQASARRDGANNSEQNADSDIVEQLRTLGQLRDDGILTEEEFQRLKRKILD